MAFDVQLLIVFDEARKLDMLHRLIQEAQVQAHDELQ